MTVRSSNPEPPPGPIYEPNYAYVKTQLPQYTLGGQDVKRPLITPRGGLPGPGRYDVSGDMKWGECKRITLKRHIRRKDSTPGPGPAAVRMKPFKTTGPKYSMPGRFKKDPVVFKNNPYVMPLEPSAPGPNYKHPDEEWLNKPKSLGIKHREDEERPGPGPGKYSDEIKTDGKSYTIGMAGREPAPIDSPGPGHYKLRTTIGKGPRAPLGVKHDRRFAPRDAIPGPDVYHRAGFRLDEPGYTMKYRWMDADPPITPGPANYDAVPPPKGPAVTIKRKTKEIPHITPGPADYAPNSGNWHKPGKSFGLHWKDMNKKPTTQDPEFPEQDKANILLPSVPSYSFKMSEKKKKPIKIPPPTAYTPMLPVSKRTISMGKAIPTKSLLPETPGPAQPPRVPERKIVYDPNCPRLLGTKAASLKSRHSPFKYTGQRNIGLLRPPPRVIGCAPLIS